MSAHVKRIHLAEEAATGRVIPAWLFWLIYLMPFLGACLARMVDRFRDDLPSLLAAVIVALPSYAVYLMLIRYRRRTIF